MCIRDSLSCIPFSSRVSCYRRARSRKEAFRLLMAIPYNERTLREWRMSDPLSSWLRRSGCSSVYAEVPFVLRVGYKAGTRHIDLVGICGDLLVAVEMKKSLCCCLLYTSPSPRDS